MPVSAFSEEDIREMEQMGISLRDVTSQIEMFKKGAPYLKLDRPCTIGDGIRLIPEKEADRLVALFHDLGPKRRLTKFVPASGAASRMFKTLLRCHRAHGELQRGAIASLAQEGDQDCVYLLRFMDHIRDFAFYDDLASAMAKDGLDTEALSQKGAFEEIVDYLLTPKGLDYIQLPKGLLKFHTYGHEARTAFEEHLVEAIDYAKDDTGLCHL
ncbi:MAG: DUF4301 family protein, partial [Thermodesulfobacteriota bacterium]|nr:DUF4301 family protein [Thermodesulfobacteriota bacterium]